jgi:3-mercaptopyruvate sulfurtransferase SseA
MAIADGYFADVAVYDGSLQEWTTDPNLPMTNPADGWP